MSTLRFLASMRPRMRFAATAAGRSRGFAPWCTGTLWWTTWNAALVNGFLRDVLAPYLNYHRPCHFPVETTDSKGRTRKRYPFENVTTPYLKLKSLDSAQRYLRPGRRHSRRTNSLTGRAQKWQCILEVPLAARARLMAGLGDIGGLASRIATR